MSTANQRLINSTAGHQVRLQRHARLLVDRMLRALAEADEDLAARIESRLLRIRTDGGPGTWTSERLRSLQDEIQALTRETYRRLGRGLRNDLVELAEHEVSFAAEEIAQAIPGGEARQVSRGAGSLRELSASRVQFSYVRPSTELLRAIVDFTPFGGPSGSAPLMRWAETLSANKVKAVTRLINSGILSGDSVDTMARALRGTRGQKGILALSNRDAATWVRTATMHVTQSGRDALYARNPDVVKAVLWNGTLDSKTCPECAGRDGKLYSVPDHKPIRHSVPWREGPGRLHPNDRCSSSPQVNPNAAPKGLRASIGGPVDRGTSFGDWLRGHPEEAERVYGKTRAKLLLQGNVDPEDFLARDGTLMTLDDLRRADGEAFKRAGLAA